MKPNKKKAPSQCVTAREAIAEIKNVSSWQLLKPQILSLTKEVRYVYDSLEAARLIQTGKWFVAEVCFQSKDTFYWILIRVA